MSCVCAAWLARGEATYRRGRCATKSNLGGREALAGVAAGRQGKCKRACTGLDWTGQSEDTTVCSARAALLSRARDRPGGGIGDGRREGGVEEVAARW